MSADDISDLDAGLATALSAHDFDRAAALLQRGADIDRILRAEELFDRDLVEETSTYLTNAATADDVELVAFLLAHGADPNIAGEYSGRTALLAAARFGHAAVVDLLVARGADPNAIDRWNAGQTPLGYATGAANPPIVRRLLAAGARPTFHRLGFSVDGGAAAREIVRALVEHGAPIDEIDDWGRTPLMWAVRYAEVETVRYMIELGADVNRVSEPNMNGVNGHDTPLGLARKEKRDDVVAELLGRGARESSSEKGFFARLRDAIG